VEYARLHGVRYLRVGNDSLNQPMLAINRRLGFRVEHERILGERFLGSGGS
jgi:RimJ/RimL family protein N-acetyltransferase